MNTACTDWAGRPALASPRVLHPGDVACGERGDRFETLLGSCVSIVLTDPRRTTGAMCHVVHAGHTPSPRAPDTAWGEAALQRLFALLQARGIDGHQCQAWVYGGGNMFPGTFGESHVGAVNARWALQALQTRGIRVLDTDLGGSHYRKLSWSVGALPPQAVRVPV